MKNKLKAWYRNGDYIKIGFSLFIVVLFIALTINLGTLVWSKFGFGIGNVEGWLSFWGSYLGGAFGAIGVIFTTLLIIKSNNKLTINSIEIQDKKSRERDFTYYEIAKLEELQHQFIRYNRLVYENFNLMRLAVNQYEDILNYKSAKGINEENILKIKKQECEEVFYEYNNLIDSYTDMLEKEIKLRFEMVEVAEIINSKLIIFQELKEDIGKYNNKVESYYNFLMENLNEHQYDSIKITELNEEN